MDINGTSDTPEATISPASMYEPSVSSALASGDGLPLQSKTDSIQQQTSLPLTTDAELRILLEKKRKADAARIQNLAKARKTKELKQRVLKDGQRNIKKTQTLATTDYVQEPAKKTPPSLEDLLQPLSQEKTISFDPEKELQALNQQLQSERDLQVRNKRSREEVASDVQQYYQQDVPTKKSRTSVVHTTAHEPATDEGFFANYVKPIAVSIAASVGAMFISSFLTNLAHLPPVVPTASTASPQSHSPAHYGAPVQTTPPVVPRAPVQNPFANQLAVI